MIRRNPSGDLPVVPESAFVDPTAIICGKVILGERVFVGPYVVIRADEVDEAGSMEPIVIGDESIESLPVTGEFDIRDRKTTIRALALAFNLESREEPTRTVLTTRASQ